MNGSCGGTRRVGDGPHAKVRGGTRRKVGVEENGRGEGRLDGELERPFRRRRVKTMQALYVDHGCEGPQLQPAVTVRPSAALQELLVEAHKRHRARRSGR